MCEGLFQVEGAYSAPKLNLEIDGCPSSWNVSRPITEVIMYFKYNIQYFKCDATYKYLFLVALPHFVEFIQITEVMHCKCGVSYPIQLGWKTNYFEFSTKTMVKNAKSFDCL